MEVENDEKSSYCELCQQEGALVACALCPRAYHKACLEPEFWEGKWPADEWLCPHCQAAKNDDDDDGDEEEEMVPDDSESCLVCKRTGFLLRCEACARFFHAYCYTPALDEPPHLEGNTCCPKCACRKPVNEAERILAWRWAEVAYPPPAVVEDLPREGETEASISAADAARWWRLALRSLEALAPRREREFFVKWKYTSYWHCEWVKDLVLEKYFKTMRTKYLEAPAVPEGGSDNAKIKVSEDHLEKNFYRFGIQPEWLRIHRIIAHVRYTETSYEYLVKWRGLAYDEATWERDDFEISFLAEAIIEYWIHRERMNGDGIPEHVLAMINRNRAASGLCSYEDEKERSSTPATDIRQRYETQPDYLASGRNLRPHQVEVVNSLRECWANGTDAVLADDAGLEGQRIQALAFLYSLMKERHCGGPFLIVAPLSALAEWERDAELWAPGFYIVTYVGGKDSRTVIREHDFSSTDHFFRESTSKLEHEERLKFHVLLTTPQLAADDAAFLSRVEWAALVVDAAESHRTHSPVFHTLRQHFHVKFRVVLLAEAGNSEEELFHSLNFLSLDRFSDLASFTRDFAELSLTGRTHKLHNASRPQVLRRSKADAVMGTAEATSERREEGL